MDPSPEPTPVRTRLPDLIALAEEPSSERRRELLRELTDHFFGHAQPNETELDLYGEVMTRLMSEMETAVRAEMSRRFATHLAAPRALIRSLALDEIGVARPVLQASPVLTEPDLLEIAQTRDQSHLRAVSQRQTVPEGVCEVIVARGDDETLRELMDNAGASLSRQASEAAVERAKANRDLHAVTVSRQSLPPDLLNDMYFSVELKLRRQILERNASLDPDVVESALAAGRAQIAEQDGVLPPDYAESQAFVAAVKGEGPLSPGILARVLRSGRPTAFRIALAEVAGVDVYTVGRILDRREIDSLAVICRAADLDGPLFLTIALTLLHGQDQAMGRARSFAVLYAALSREAAQRTLRFWRMRRTLP